MHRSSHVSRLSPELHRRSSDFCNTLELMYRRDKDDPRRPLRIYLDDDGIKSLGDTTDKISLFGDDKEILKAALANHTLIITSYVNSPDEFMQALFTKDIDPKKGVVITIDEATHLKAPALATIIGKIIGKSVSTTNSTV